MSSGTSSAMIPSVLVALVCGHRDVMSVSIGALVQPICMSRRAFARFILLAFELPVLALTYYTTAPQFVYRPPPAPRLTRRKKYFGVRLPTPVNVDE